MSCSIKSQILAGIILRIIGGGLKMTVAEMLMTAVMASSIWPIHILLV